MRIFSSAWSRTMLWRWWPCQQQRLCDRLQWRAGPQESHSLSQVATYSEMVCITLFCTHPSVPCGCYFNVCVCLCVSVWVSRLQRAGWSGLENILCDSTSGLAALSSDIPFSLPHCTSLTVHSLCLSMSLSWMEWCDNQWALQIQKHTKRERRKQAMSKRKRVKQRE